MLIGEFNSRFASREESGFLFQVMRRLSLLDSRTILATEAAKWGEWPPDSPDSPDDPNAPQRRLARQRLQVS
ncbi:MAG TPA: hypothetical protein VLE27_10500 [Thermoanaerobaculia bacterium]|nr:hypothetical protein [Thermoanaerobaculia bacterium]